MNVLGIETSCDETSAAVVVNGRKVLSNIVASSLKFHQKYGGVIPEIASRMHLDTISFVVDNSLKDAGIKLKDIDLISVTNTPGLFGSLLVGVSFAKALSFANEKPLIGVDHIQSHIYANFLNSAPIKFPFIGLVISGGHTSLFLASDFNKTRLLGSTQDDACGEAFDKVAKILGLGYPGGPVIEKIALKYKGEKIKFNCSKTNQPLDFSFSGIKTAVLYYTRSQKSPLDLTRGRKVKSQKMIAGVASSFQETVIDTLIKKSFLACKEHRIQRLVVGGGVVCNNRLRERFRKDAVIEGIKVYFPDKEFCMDNAAMISGFGYQLYKKGIRSVFDLNPVATL